MDELLADYRKNGESWENKTIGDFLESLATYAVDVEGYYNNLAKTDGEKVEADLASWRVFADMLRGATMYE